jgi:hypothetical protein
MHVPVSAMHCVLPWDGPGLKDACNSIDTGQYAAARLLAKPLVNSWSAGRAAAAHTPDSAHLLDAGAMPCDPERHLRQRCKRQQLLKHQQLHTTCADQRVVCLQAFRGTALAARPATAARAQQRQRLAVSADAMKTESVYSTAVKVGGCAQLNELKLEHLEWRSEALPSCCHTQPQEPEALAWLKGLAACSS